MRVALRRVELGCGNDDHLSRVCVEVLATSEQGLSIRHIVKENPPLETFRFPVLVHVWVEGSQSSAELVVSVML